MQNAALSGRDDGKTVTLDPLTYREYIELLLNVFKHLRSYYRSGEDGMETQEEVSMALYASKFLNSVRALRFKFRWSPLYLGQPGVDLKESGFPNFIDIMRLETDLGSRGERLPKLPPLEDLKLMFLNHFMSLPEDPEERQKWEDKNNGYCWQIAERSYLEMLNLRTVFFMFTPGKVFPVLDAEDKLIEERGRRAFHFSWGCYDSDRNRPCVYFMYLEQDTSEPRLDLPDSQGYDPSYFQFLHLIQHIGGRAPDNLMAMAAALDESLDVTLHPKVLKRITFGPLVSPLLYRAHPPEKGSVAERLLPLFSKAQLSESDFVIFFTSEMVTSDRESIPPRRD